MSLRTLPRLAAACLSVGLFALAADAQRVERAEITLTGGLSSGGPVTFELHHTSGVARLQTTLGFFEPPAIVAEMVSDSMRPLLPSEWTIEPDGPRIVLGISGTERLLDSRVCPGSAPCPPSASLDTPQVVAGQTWTQEVFFRPPAHRAVSTEIFISGGLSSGGPITFELHHTSGVVRLQTTLGFFEPPFISALMVAGHVRPLLPRGWTIEAEYGPVAARLVITAGGAERLLESRVCQGSRPCPPSASLTRPQFVAGQTWTLKPPIHRTPIVRER